MNPDHVIAGWVAQLSLDSRGGATRRAPGASPLRPLRVAAARPVVEPTAAPAVAAPPAASAGERVRFGRLSTRRRGGGSGVRRQPLGPCAELAPAA